MIAGLPRQPDGNSSEAVFHRNTYENLSRSRMTQAPGMRVNNTTRGVSVVPVAQQIQRAVRDLTTKWCRVIEVHASDNYLLCHPTDDSDDIKVAFPLGLMNLLHASDDIPGIGTVAYDYTDENTDQRRLATLEDASELQFITPAYIAYPGNGWSLILALRVDTGYFLGGTEQLEWQDLNIDGRAWSWDYNLS